MAPRKPSVLYNGGSVVSRYDWGFPPLSGAL
jgi:hypothetical protein